MYLDEFYKLMPQLLQAPLGGIEAQFKLAPAYRSKYDLDIIKSSQPKQAAVLILLYPDIENKIRFVLTKRPDYSGDHANQISFTGGKKSILDTDLSATAMRETEEEIGIQIKRSQIFKTLTEVYIPPSNFLVQPYLALVSETPIFKPNYEVEKILTPFLSELINPKIIQQDVSSKNGIIRKSHGFILENEFVWGATAMILSEIKDLFDKIYK